MDLPSPTLFQTKAVGHSKVITCKQHQHPYLLLVEEEKARSIHPGLAQGHEL
jgi:hypothetical protein